MVEPAVTEYLTEPMLQGFCFQLPEDTSLSLSLALSAFGFRRGQTLTLDGGIGLLPEMLASRLDVTLNCPAISLQVGKDSVTVVTGQSHLQADHVVLAVPATQGLCLCPDADALAQRLMATRYSANINIAVRTGRGFSTAGQFEPDLRPADSAQRARMYCCRRHRSEQKPGPSASRAAFEHHALRRCFQVHARMDRR
ncbi:hypothetical protein [Polaromonas sp. CG9_12]|nr:hypothetical protein [Polaromonas sp. CG9_12]